MRRLDRVGRASASLAPAVAVVAILGAALVAPEFSWTDGALSDLGAPGTPTAWLFNGGLVLAALLGVPFATALAAGARTRLDGLAAASLVVTLALLAGVGLFPSGHPLHLPVAVGFYLGATLALWIDGTSSVVVGEPRFGLGTIWLANLHVLQWLAWAVGLRAGSGLAVPEAIGAALFAAWVLARGRRMGLATTAAL
ncbi:DUF998 domain-containing protein [Halalkalicoccus sp. NIPERK01]|uniref:DUF998 domain-containing protein n=1 Tax=Halalkalicoccus sp. NIPERK01 TaxID=3053469 RepID=UPI00256EF52A|nr:DUF998 domain-containing protein [Halalkalicoccus sp. NIPERK01]MDL5360713.1 DUF998 domain-containing protein [Halalkalicoccus sp. NIPERK01]